MFVSVEPVYRACHLSDAAKLPTMIRHDVSDPNITYCHLSGKAFNLNIQDCRPL